MAGKEELLRSPIIAFHRANGARMTEFAGWEMPLQFSGIVDEHLTVRRAAGLFDISHMAQIEVLGKSAFRDLQRILTRSLQGVVPGRAVYSLLCNEDGGILDDVIVYKRAEDRFLVVVNAVNSTKDFQWLREKSSRTTEVRSLSTSRALLAVQGPDSAAIVGQLTEEPLTELFYFRFREDILCGFAVVLARTGYTGEDGFEISVGLDDALDLWSAILRAGEEFGLKPAGLGARDTLRLEMAYPLYGMEISESVSPFEARLHKAVSLGKGDFIGREAILEKGKKSQRTLVGLEMLEKGIPRPHFWVKSGATTVGTVTSGTMSPTLRRGIALAFVRREFSELGTVLGVEIRGSVRSAAVVRTPFCIPRPYLRSSASPERAGEPDPVT